MNSFVSVRMLPSAVKFRGNICKFSTSINIGRSINASLCRTFNNLPKREFHGFASVFYRSTNTETKKSSTRTTKSTILRRSCHTNINSEKMEASSKEVQVIKKLKPSELNFITGLWFATGFGYALFGTIYFFSEVCDIHPVFIPICCVIFVTGGCRIVDQIFS